MALQCILCGDETQLFVDGEPVCVGCDQRRSGSVAICSICHRLMNELITETKNYDCAVTRVLAASTTTEYDQRKTEVEYAANAITRVRQKLEIHWQEHRQSR